MLKIYGVTESRALRCLWMAEELGLDFERVAVHYQGDAQKPDFLKINPNGRIPVLEDEGLVLFESMAINLHLASKYGRPPLWPASQDDRSRAVQWSFWCMTEGEGPALTLLRNRALRPESDRDPRAAAEAERALHKPLAVLDGALADRDHLLGSEFSVADLNVACVFAWPANFKAIDLSAWKNVRRWCASCNGRPALARALGRG